jgi:thymidylate synthase (FAD)
LRLRATGPENAPPERFLSVRGATNCAGGLQVPRLYADERYRTDPNADAICKVVADRVPIAYGAFEDCRMGGVALSSKAVDCVRRMLKDAAVTQETSGMSKGEWREFEGVIG